MERKTDSMYLASKVTEFAETKSYLELTNRLCYYDAPNLNGVELPSDGALEKAQTLINEPVVAKYKMIGGKDDLGGHEAYFDPVTQEMKFGTQNVGTHVEVEVKDDEVEVEGQKRTLPCLFAKSRIWKQRNQNVVKAVKRLFNEGKLYTSWELLKKAARYEDDREILTDYEFIGNCLLGSQSPPAYGNTAETLSLASLEEANDIIAAACEQDMQNQNKKEKDTMNEEEKKIPETAETAEEPEVQAPDTAEAEPEAEPAEPVATAEPEGEPAAEPEVSALTSRDIARHIDEALRADEVRIKYGYCDLAFLFPEEHKFLACAWDLPNELDFYQGEYFVEDNFVRISEELEKVTLAVSVSEINNTLAEMNAALAAANQTIVELKAQVDELEPYKAEAERVKAEKEAAEKKEKQDALAEYARKSSLFSEEELSDEKSDVYKFISELDKAAIDNEIGARFMRQLSERQVSGAETSEVKTAAEQPKNVSRACEDDFESSEEQSGGKGSKSDDAFYAYINK